VVGAGIIGMAAALELSRRGANVLLIDSGAAGPQASRAAAGILGAQVEAHSPGAFFEQLLRARNNYAAWVSAIEEQSGLNVEYICSGAINLAFDDAEERDLRTAAAWQAAAGARTEWLSAREVLAYEPLVSPDIRGANYCPDEAQVNPALLTEALLCCVVRQPRIQLQTQADVQALWIEDGVCLGVQLGGARIQCRRVVLAAGSWAGGFAHQVPEARGIRPIRGQLMELVSKPALNEVQVPALRHILFRKGMYLVPRGDKIVCGATLEDVGHTPGVTAEGTQHIRENSVRCMPTLANYGVQREWFGFRPGGGGPPQIGASSIPGLYLAAGHFRNGILLAQDTALQIAAQIAIEVG
jgi:glycine oxidase